MYETLETVQKKREVVQPNMAFMGQLVHWEDQLKSDGGKNKMQKEKDWDISFKALSNKETAAIKEILSATDHIKIK